MKCVWPKTDRVRARGGSGRVGVPETGACHSVCVVVANILRLARHLGEAAAADGCASYATDVSTDGKAEADVNSSRYVLPRASQ